MRGAGGLLLAGVLALAGCHAKEEATSANQAAAEPTGGLIDQVVETPEGGFRMGSPTAKAALVEYGSYTCPHCAVFAADAMPDIRRMVASGNLSFELRPYARDVIDLTAALVTRCAGPKGFYPISDQILAAQQEWIGNAQNMTPADMDKIDALPPNQQFRALARGTGLNAFAGKRGIGDATLDQCLTDPKAIAAVVATHDRANRDYHLDSTPTFLINGKVVGSADWKGLKPQVEAAIGH